MGVANNLKIRNELIAAFQLIGSVPDIYVMSKCIHLCKKYEISPDEFVDLWIAFALSNFRDLSELPSLSSLGLLEKEELCKGNSIPTNLSTPQESEPAPTVKKHVGLLDILPDDFERRRREKNPEIKPVSSHGFTLDDMLISQSPKPEEALPISKCEDEMREDAGVIVLTHGVPSTFLSFTVPVEITQLLPLICIKPPNYNYMQTNMEIFDIATNIANTAHSTGCLIMRHHKILPTYDFADRYMPDVAVYGRVHGVGNEKLKVEAILMETPLRGSINGELFTLDTSLLNECSIFSGQVVVVKGSISNRTTLLAKEMMTNSFHKAKVTAHLSEPIEIVAAAGPFTIKDNLKYEPLEELMNYVLQKMPHVLILMGPFLNDDHDRVKDFSLRESYDSFFIKIIEAIMKSLHDTNIQVVLVSSHKDVHHNVVYPTMEYKMKKKYPNLLCMPDPCLLNVNGVIIGVTTADVLYHMGQQELHWPAGGGDRIARLATSLLNQSTFYPLYPPDPSMSVDHGLLRKYGRMTRVPNVLLLPSTLKYFVKDIKGCTVINPERLVHGYTAGMFTRFQITQKENLEVSCEIIRV